MNKLLKEIEKLEAEYRHRMLEDQDDGDISSRILSVLGYIHQFGLVEQKIQQAERKKLITTIMFKQLIPATIGFETPEPLTDEQNGYNRGLRTAIAIIKGESEKQE
jgi:hypothetical protein